MSGLKKEDLPRFHYVSGHVLRVAAEFPDTPEGTTEANKYMEENPAGVLDVSGGVITLANMDEKPQAIGPVGPALRLLCSCCGAVTTGRQWHNRDSGWGLCDACIEYCGRKETPESFQRIYGLFGIHYGLRAPKA